MKRRNKLWLMAGVLTLTLVLTLGIALVDQHMEKIRSSGETILSIPADSVTALSWDYEGQTLSFTRDDSWHYAGDPDFPVSALDMENILDPLGNLTAAFRIEDVEDYDQYGFADPVCTVAITAGDQSFTLRLGAYSKMDQQRYADIGDGNVYLLHHDPMEEFGQGLSDVIENDDIPYLDSADTITFTGAQTYTILREPEGAVSHRPEDRYFAKIEGQLLPLSTPSVENFLSSLTMLDLTGFQTYTASREGLDAWGLDQPDLTIRVDYTREETDGSFTLMLAREESEEDPENAPVYAHLEGSELVYAITPAEYDSLTACGYDDLRHAEIFPAPLDQVQALEIRLDGGVYEIAAGEEEDAPFLYLEQEVDLSPVITALGSLHAGEFTREPADGPLEIRLTADLKTGEQVTLELYRKDGTHCTALVDGQVVALIPRAQAVELMEQIRTIVLTPPQPAEAPEENP